MNEKKKKQPMSVVKLVLIDTGLLAISMGVFLYFDYLRPQSYSTEDSQVVADASDSATFTLPASSDDAEDTTETISPEATKSATTSDDTDTSTDSSSSSSSHHSSNGKNTGNTGTTDISSDDEVSSITADMITETALDSYSDDSMQISITKKEYGSGSDLVTYYVADVYVSSVSQLMSAFAEDTYGKNIKDDVDSMAEENQALLAINGDFYGNSEEGVVIRNGVLYRDNVNDADICVLFQDGTMKTYSSDEFDGDTVISEGAWQAWNFGPALLDGSGSVLSSFNTTSYLNSENPRTAIGYVEPGHYVLVVVDGRDEGYSRGCTLSELAQFMSLEGCQTAYNLDGGKSSAMYFNGSYVNQPADGGREISDIIYMAVSN